MPNFSIGAAEGIGPGKTSADAYSTVHSRRSVTTKLGSIYTRTKDITLRDIVLKFICFVSEEAQKSVHYSLKLEYHT